MNRILSLLLLLLLAPVTVFAQNVNYSDVRAMRSTQSLAVVGGTIDTQPIDTAGVHQLGIQWKVATVAGTYTTCTVQAKTTFDGGTNYLTLGSAASITVTTGTNNAWTLTAPLATTVSSTVANSFGERTKFTFACSGAYGTSAPTVVSVIGATATGSSGGGGTITSFPDNEPFNLQQVLGSTLSATNPVFVSEVVGTTAGCTPNSLISAGSVNETEVKATAGKLYSIWAMSLDATPVYIKIYNDTAANTDQTDTPLIRIMVPANSTATLGAGFTGLNWPTGVTFGTAITFRATTGIADNDTGALTANEVIIGWCFN